jgi:hypothetical protein
VAYFYCQYNNELTKTPLNVITTLLAQLLHGLDSTLSKELIAELFPGIARGQGPPASVRRLIHLVGRVIELYHRVMIVIDGIDECPLELRRELLDFIGSVASGIKASILITSRKEVDIEDELIHFPTISLDHEHVNLKEDMQKLIHEEFLDTKKWGRRFQTLKDEITTSLILGSGKNM